METTIAIIPETPWIGVTEAAKLARRDERTIQRAAQRGDIRAKPAGRDDKPNAFLYETSSVLKYMEKSGQPSPRAVTQRLNRQAQKERQPEEGALVRSPRREVQEARALDTVSIVGQMLAGQKAERELVARNQEKLVEQMGKNLERVVEMILMAQREEANANRERLKAEREDARERWEIERRDRLERQRNRRAAHAVGAIGTAQ